MSPSSTPDPSLERWQEIEAVLDRLLDAEPPRWPTLLDEACGGDADLRREVEDLLRHHEPSRDFLGAPAAELATELMTEGGDPTQRVPSFEGRRIGPYRVVREIGRGGMGRVFLAERADGAFEQRVALKLLRPGLDNPESERRFASERRILAALEHPAIARLLDGGVTPEGLSWLAMEYVEGRPIHEYCEARKLSVRQRLELFLALTSAVQYAHRNLVVHRDLKPSNIQIDADGELKLLDFGIAKLLSGGEGDAVALTRPGQRFLTPEYSAPEQVRGEPVTTATDVYQLGVVLYELLAGRRPFEGKGTSLHELEVAILEREPERPSTAVAGSGEEAESRRRTQRGRSVGGRTRPISPHRRRKILTRDLDAIVLKALRKDPELRYASAGEMGEDVRRYLTGLPVQAHEGSRAYRVRKFARRHRWRLAAAAGFALIVTGFGTVYIVQVTRERSRAQREAAKAAQVTGFLMGLFEANDPREARGDSITARELLEGGLEQVETLGDQPEVQAQMLDVVGSVFRSLGQYDRARPLLERALAMRRDLPGEEHPDVALSLEHLASVLEDQGDYEAAEPLYREALAMRRRLLGEKHPDVAESLDDLASMLKALGDYEAAEPLFREALAMRRDLLGEEHPDVATTMNNLGLLLMRTGDYDQAEAFHRDALAMRRQLLGEDHLDVTYSLNNLALVLHNRGDYKAAEALYRELIALDRKLLGEEHPDYALDLNNLGGLLQDKGDFDGAEALYREALAIYRSALGPTHPRIAQTLNNLAALMHRERDYEAAEPLYREALAMRRELLGDEHPAVATVMSNLGQALVARGEHDEAEALHREALEIRRERLGPLHPDVAQSLHNVASVLLLEGDPERAEFLFQEAIEIDGAALGAAHWVTAYHRSGLGACLTALGRYAEAEALLLEAHEVLRTERGDQDSYTARVRERLVTLYEAWGRPDQAARYRSRLSSAPTPRAREAR